MAYDEDEDDEEYQRAAVNATSDVPAEIETDVHTVLFASHLRGADLDKEHDRVPSSSTVKKAAARDDARIECDHPRRVVERDAAQGVRAQSTLRESSDAQTQRPSVGTKAHEIGTKTDGNQKQTTSKKTKSSAMTPEVISSQAVKSRKSVPLTVTLACRWCAVRIQGLYDDAPLPGILYDEVGALTAEMSLPKNFVAKDHHAVRFLSLGPDHIGNIFLFAKNLPTVSVSSSIEQVRSACKEVLGNKVGKISSFDISERNPLLSAKHFPKVLNDIMRDNQDKRRTMCELKEDTLAWFEGDIYVYTRRRKTGQPGIKDKFFIRINRSTGSALDYQNCSSTGEHEPGSKITKLRSASAAESALKRARELVEELRFCWKRFETRAVDSEDVPATLEELKVYDSVILGDKFVQHRPLKLIKKKLSQVKTIPSVKDLQPVLPPIKKGDKKVQNTEQKNKRASELGKVEKTAAVKRPRVAKTIKAPIDQNMKPWGGYASPRVVVIGAGPAGLSAARSLKEHGMNDVIILESRDRPGGRCHTMEMPALPLYSLPSINVDLGASYVHGCGDYNPLFVIAKKNKVPLNTAGGGYSAGWGVKAPWYNAIEGGKVSEKIVVAAFRLAEHARHRMFMMNEETSGMDEIWSSSPKILTPTREEQQMHKTGLNLTKAFSELVKDNLASDEAYRKKQRTLETALSDGAALLTTTTEIYRTLDNRGESACSLHDAFQHATKCELKRLLNGEKRAAPLRPVYDCIPSVIWGYVAPVEDISYHLTRSLERDIVEIKQGYKKPEAHSGRDISSSDEAANDIEVLTENTAVEKYEDGLVVNGYKHLLIDRLIDNGESKLDIKYSHAVNEVHVNAAGQGAACVVKCKDGFEINCDYVVVTVPLGVLKRNIIKFKPELSEKKIKAIQALGMGTENKVYMRFHEMFWPAKSRYLQCTDQRYRFLNLDMYGKKNTLLVHISPPYAHDFNDNLDDRIVIRDICELCKRMFKLKETPEPVDSHVTRWGQDEHAYGAYSYFPVGSTFEDVEALAMHEYDGRVYFAGEACSVDGAQCVHGAVVTGNAAAVSILGLGDVDIHERNIVGEHAGLHLDEPVYSVQCSKCEKWRTRPLPAKAEDGDDDSKWECSQGGKWNTYLGTYGCAYR